MTDLLDYAQKLVEAYLQSRAKFIHRDVPVYEQLKIWTGLPHFYVTIVSPLLFSVLFAKLWIDQRVTWVFPRATEFATLTVLSFVLTLAFYATGYHGYSAVVILPLYPPVLAVYMFRASRILGSPPSSLVIDAGFFASLTYLTCLVTDIPIALLTGIGIAGVGSAGFKDGLFVYPAASFCFCLTFLFSQRLRGVAWLK